MTDTPAFNTTIFELAKQLGDCLLEKKQLLATAESCTGGGIASAITDIPGSSQWFERGFVTYSNAAKTGLLGVKTDTLQRFGAVSAETAMEMAEGCLAHSLADIAVSVTGIAGPTGGTAEKPVGTVFIGLSVNGKPSQIVHKLFQGNRQQIRQQTIVCALQQIIKSQAFDLHQ